MGTPESKARTARERAARDAEYADFALREPVFFDTPKCGSVSLLERLAFASATKAEIDAIDKAIVEAFNRHHWDYASCPGYADLAQHVRHALIRRGMKIGGKKRVAKIVRLIRNRAFNRTRPGSDEENPDLYWWRR